jgi:insulysin
MSRKSRQKAILCGMIGISALVLALLTVMVAHIHQKNSADAESAVDDTIDTPKALRQLRLQEPPTGSAVSNFKLDYSEEVSGEGGAATTIRQSPHDDREYKYLVLDNNLRVTLISDAATPKAAAAMDVFVGCLSDPEDIPGLAHLLEHMLFMGSEKFPKENALEDLLAKHGGSSNAFTSLDETVYFFDIEHKALSDALKVWSQLFVSPLLKSEAIQREVHAVNAEHTKNIENDGWRLEQLLKTTSSYGHPYHKFCTGDIDTLWNSPRANGRDLHAEILTFYEEHYSANLMRLVVIGREPIEALESMVRTYFKNVPNAERPRVNYDAAPVRLFFLFSLSLFLFLFLSHYSNTNPSQPPIQTPHLNHQLKVREPDQLALMYEVMPRQNIQVLTMLWLLPSLLEHHRTKPLEYVSHLLGHEGPGSLLSELKHRGWANEITSGVADKGLDFTWFNLEIDLSDEGAKNKDAVIMIVYEYISLIKTEGPAKWRWDEMAQVAMSEFQFLEKEEPSDYAEELVQNMQLYGPDHIISAELLFEDWDENVIESVLSQLTPNRMVVTLQTPDLKLDMTKPSSSSSKNNRTKGTKQSKNSLLPDEFLRRDLPDPDRSTRVEHWYRTLYREKKMSSDFIMQALRPASVSTGMKLPEINPYIATDFTVVGGNEKKKEETKEDKNTTNVMRHTRPNLLLDESCFRVWMHTDRHFLEPRITIFLRVETQGDDMSAETMMRRELVEMLLRDYLSEKMYAGQVAGLDYDVEMGERHFTLSVQGFSHKMAPYMDDLLHTIVKFRVTPNRLKVVLETMQRELQNFDSEEPYKQTSVIRRIASVPDMFFPSELLEASKRADFSELVNSLQSEVQRMFKTGNIEMLVHGNANTATAQQLAKIVAGTFSPQDDSSKCPRTPMRVREFPKGSTPHVFQYKSPNAETISSAALNSYQMGPRSIERDVRCELLQSILHEPIFDQLRTKEQLGYIVATKLKRNFGTQNVQIIVQSPSKSAEFLSKRVEDYLNTFLKTTLSSLSPAALQSHIAALANEKLAPFKTAFEEAGMMWSEISTRQYRFDRRFLEVEALREITSDDILKLYAETIVGSSRRVSSFQIFGKDHTNSNLPSRSIEIAKDVRKHTKSLSLYPAQPERNPSSSSISSSSSNSERTDGSVPAEK